MLYTDGIEVVKSSNYQFWPVFTGICELPSTIRDSLHNKIIAGIWFGKNKPTSDILFSSLIQEVKRFGFVEIKTKNITKRIFIDFYGLVADTPAKAICTRMTNFNGYYGCTYCLNPGIA